MRRIAEDPEGAKKGAGVIEGAVFGLLSLMVAFTFSGAVGRLDARRHLVSEEAIRIGTAFERISCCRTMRSRYARSVQALPRCPPRNVSQP